MYSIVISKVYNFHQRLVIMNYEMKTVQQEIQGGQKIPVTFEKLM